MSLLCLHPSAVGGKSKVSNACNAFDSISRMPNFLMNELLRPVSRDILEKGKGNQRRLSMSSQMSRAAPVLSLRIGYNSYPIFEVQQDRMRFRYMRHWIESSHMKMRWRVPTLLRIAMDVLDDALDEGCCFHKSLARGDILICNNACIVRAGASQSSNIFFFCVVPALTLYPLPIVSSLQAHGRDSFRDTPGESPRHLVRAWMQMQKVDLLKPMS